MKENHRITRRDIAKMANVSVAAVSYALSGNLKKQISEETCERICRIARENGYTPNFTARALASGKSYNIGFVCPAAEWLLDPMFQYIQYGVVCSINQTNYNINCFYQLNDKFFQKLEEARLDGLILFSNHMTEEIAQTLELPIPIVAIDLFLPDSLQRTDIVCVCSDYTGIVQKIFAEFAAIDCRNIAAIIPLSPDCQPNDILAESFLREALKYKQSGMNAVMFNPRIEDHGLKCTGFEAMVEKVLQSGEIFDGVYIDVYADYGRRFLELAAAAGKIPGRDFELILTDTARREYKTGQVWIQDGELLGRMAWQTLKDLLAGNPSVQNVTVPFRKIEQG